MLFVVLLAAVFPNVNCASRIGEGFEPDNADFSFVVLILGQSPSTCVCTGTILTPRVVLTGQQCTNINGVSVRKGDLTVYYGRHQYSMDDLEEYQSVLALIIVTKDLQTRDLAATGIALFKTDKAIEFESGRAGAAVLKRTTPVGVREESVCVGFGCDSCRKWRNLTMTSTYHCHFRCEAVPDCYIRGTFGHNEAFFCPRGTSWLQALIEGDDGAPLICKERNYVCGIAYTSRKIQNTKQGNQMVFLTLDRYIPWIEQEVEGLVVEDY